MSTFRYQALDKTGRTVRGVLEGDRPRHVRTVLREKGLTPLHIESLRQKAQSPVLKFSFRPRLSHSELALLTRQFSTLVRAGLPIEESLTALMEQTGSEATRLMLAGLRGRVLEGLSLAKSMESYPRIFPRVYVQMIEAGEQSGKLDEVLERLADDTENRQALQQKVVLALVYPALLTVVAVAVVTGLLVSVVPQVTRVFLNTGQTLPWSTQALMALSQSLRAMPLLWIGLPLALGVGIRMGFRHPSFRQKWDEWVLHVPLLGRLIKGLNAARFTNTLGILTASGLSLTQALHSATQVISNGCMKRAVQQASKEVEEGKSLSRSLSHCHLFPPLVIHLIASGESSGQLAPMLQKAAQAQKKELETWVSTLTTLVEPLLILLMGGAVLFIVLAILSPIMEINQLVR